MVYVIQVCSRAVSKLVWHIPLLCVQWKTPDDGQRNCPKHVEFYSKNKFEKLVHLVGFIIRKNPLTTYTSHRFHIYLVLSPDYAIGPNSLYLCHHFISYDLARVGTQWTTWLHKHRSCIIHAHSCTRFRNKRIIITHSRVRYKRNL